MKKKIIFLIFLLVTFGLFLRGSSDTFHGGNYRPTLTTTQKFTLLAPLIPAASDVVLAIDLSRITPLQREMFSTWVNLSLFELTPFGMAAVAISLEEREGIFFLQGPHDQKTVLAAVSDQLSQEGISLEPHVVENHILFTESTNEESALSLTFLDDLHIAVGGHKILTNMLKTDRNSTPSVVSELTDLAAEGILFGVIRFGAWSQDLLPEELVSFQSLRFFSPDGEQIMATIECRSLEEVIHAELFFAGIKALLMLQYEEHPQVVEALKGVTFSPKATTLHIRASVPSLVHLSTFLKNTP